MSTYYIILKYLQGSIVMLVNNNNKKQKAKKKKKKRKLFGSCTPCGGKMTRKENLEQCEKPFLRAPP